MKPDILSQKKRLAKNKALLHSSCFQPTTARRIFISPGLFIRAQIHLSAASAAWKMDDIQTQPIYIPMNFQMPRDS